VDSVAAAEHEGPPAPTRTPTRNGGDGDDDDDDNVRPDGTNGDGPMDDVLAGPGRLGPLARLGPQSSVLESRRFDGRDTRGPARRKSRLDIAINDPLPTHYLSSKKIGSPGDSKKLQFALFSRRLFSRIPLDSAVALRISFVYIHMRLLRQSGAVKSRSCPLARSRMGPTPRNTDHCEG